MTPVFKANSMTVFRVFFAHSRLSLYLTPWSIKVPVKLTVTQLDKYPTFSRERKL